jgi:hypothetical protein
MSEEKEKEKQKIKKITLSYSIESFETLTNYHKAKGIAEACFVLGLVALMLGYYGFDHISMGAIGLVFGLMYKIYEKTLAKRLAKDAKWEERELDEDIPEFTLLSDPKPKKEEEKN